MERRHPACRIAAFQAAGRLEASGPAGWKPALLIALFLLACTRTITPVQIDPNADTCHSCRMTISNPRFAVQVLDPGEEPRLYDDIGCAVNDLRQNGPKGRVIFVADWKTGAWMPNSTAVFERCTHADTPMASHLVAMKTASGDPRCTSVPWKEILR